MSPSQKINDWIAEQMAQIDHADLRRKLRNVQSPQGVEITLGGRKLLNFSSNDYLGLCNHSQIKEAAQAALEKYGTGAGASRLVSGNLPPQQELDAQIARWKGTPAALSFSSGFAAALGTITALCTKSDVIILDKLVHACIVDGARMSGATIRVYPHNDLDKLRKHLEWATDKLRGSAGKILVITESVFSMDGDRAPLRQIVELKDRYQAALMVDEAHALGVLGKTGAGLVEELGLAGGVEIQMGTMSKALGSGGGYVAGSRALIDFLVNRARSMIFSTALPPATCAAAIAAIEIVSGAQGAERRKLLGENIANCAGYLCESSVGQSAILPVIIGHEARAVEVADELLQEGIFVPAIRYPTVAKGTARLRISLSADHSPAQIARLGEMLRQKGVLTTERG